MQTNRGWASVARLVCEAVLFCGCFYWNGALMATFPSSLLSFFILLCFLCFQITFLEWVNFSLAAKRLKFYFDAI
jgi:putative effector of murein hydrolase LrgA (UPF0299 family)